MTNRNRIISLIVILAAILYSFALGHSESSTFPLHVLGEQGLFVVGETYTPPILTFEIITTSEEIKPGDVVNDCKAKTIEETLRDHIDNVIVLECSGGIKLKLRGVQFK